MGLDPPSIVTMTPIPNTSTNSHGPLIFPHSLLQVTPTRNISCQVKIPTSSPSRAALQVWWDWAPEYRDRDPAALEAFSKENAGRIDTFIALQFLFDYFWTATKVGGGRGLIRIM